MADFSDNSQAGPSRVVDDGTGRGGTMEETVSSQYGSSEEKIALYLIDGVATVWDPQVAATLHCTHGISGLRAGTLPGVSQQNAFLGLPLTLMREETAYLVSTGLAYLIPVSRPSLPSSETIAKHTAERVARIKVAEAKKTAHLQKMAMKSAEAFEKGGDKAREKREARAKAKAEKMLAAQAAKNDGSLFVDAPSDIATPAPAPAMAPAPTSVSAKKQESHGYFFSVPGTPIFPSLSQHEPITTLPHPLFPFPSSPRDYGLVATFKELAAREFRVGLGPRFGGEYLIYPGDYLRYHAHFTSQVIVRDEPIKPTEIVAWGRLGTGTKKAGLLCCWDDEKEGDVVGEGDVEFYSLEWANFG